MILNSDSNSDSVVRKKFQYFYVNNVNSHNIIACIAWMF